VAEREEVMKEGKTLVYFANGIGNFIMMMPALQFLAEEGDIEGKIDIVLPTGWRDYRRNVVKEIAQSWSIVRKVYHEQSEFMDLVKSRDNYNVFFISPHGSNGYSEVHLFQQGLAPFPAPDWLSGIHEVDYYLNHAATVLGCPVRYPQVQFPVSPVPISSSLKCSKLKIALCNGAFATPYWLKKRWKGFSSLAQTLRKWIGATVIGIGGEKELSGVKLDFDFTGRLSFCETAYVLSYVDILITTDTAVMHLADLMGIPLVAIFGPTSISKNGPRSQNSLVLTSGANCAPCQFDRRFLNCGVASCMNDVISDEVMAGVRWILRKLEEEEGFSHVHNSRAV